jgi:hypothetical protein
MLPCFASAQTIHWIENNEKTNYVEGKYSVQISVPLIEIISLHTLIESYQFKSNQKLNVEFFSPTSEAYYLSASELNRRKFYLLMSKNQIANKGINVFGSWDVNGYLSMLRIEPKNLGVLLRLKEPNSKYFIPTAVYYSKKVEKLDTYQAFFRLHQLIDTLEINVYKGEHLGVLPKDQISYKDQIENLLPGTTCHFSIPFEKFLDYEGWLTVEIIMFIGESARKETFRFFFFHHIEK